MKTGKFFQPEGDHLTLLAVYNSWRNNKFLDKESQRLLLKAKPKEIEEKWWLHGDIETVKRIIQTQKE